MQNNDNLFSTNNILKSGEYIDKGHTPKKRGKSTKVDKELESVATLGSFDDNTFSKTLYAEDMNFCLDQDVEGVYQGFDEDRYTSTMSFPERYSDD